MTDMTIKAVRTTMLRVPWPDTPWLKGHAFGEARNLLVLEVETKGGIVGMGYLFSFRPGLRTVAAALEETILPHVIGKDATAVEGIWNETWKRTVTYNRGGIVTMAMSALDIALWDAIGKRANMPLHRLWGHVKSQMPVYGSGCFRGSGGDGMIAKALYYKERGYKAIKMQMAHTADLRGDVENVRRMREALDVSAKHGLPRYECVQPNYNLYNRSDYESELEPLCLKEEIGCIPYYALASGFLTGK